MISFCVLLLNSLPKKKRDENTKESSQVLCEKNLWQSHAKWKIRDFSHKLLLKPTTGNQHLWISGNKKTRKYRKGIWIQQPPTSLLKPMSEEEKNMKNYWNFIGQKLSKVVHLPLVHCCGHFRPLAMCVGCMSRIAKLAAWDNKKYSVDQYDLWGFKRVSARRNSNF